MGVLQKFEQRLGNLVEGAFAKVFKGQVEPVEVAAALQREAEQSKAIVGADRTLIHNDYVVELGPSDAERLLPYEGPLADEFAAMVTEYAKENGWAFPGPVAVHLVEVDGLDTGVFRVRSSVEGQGRKPAGDQQRPANGHARAGRPRLMLTHGGEAALGSAAAAGVESVIDLTQTVTVLGRGSDVDLQIEDTGISRRHAEIRFEGDQVHLIDLGSTNGTRINGGEIHRGELSDGDRIEIGRTTLVFHRDQDRETFSGADDGDGRHPRSPQPGSLGADDGYRPPGGATGPEDQP